MLSIVIIVVGFVILGFGINSSQKVTEKIIEDISGRYSDKTMWYIIGGIAMIVGGSALAFLSYKNKKTIL